MRARVRGRFLVPAESVYDPGDPSVLVSGPHRTGTALNSSQFFRDLTVPFYGFNREGVEDNAGFRYSFWLMGMSGGAKGHYMLTIR